MDNRCKAVEFRMAYGKAIPYIEGVMLAMLLFLAYIWWKINVWAGLITLAVTIVLGVLLYIFLTRSRYVITDKEIRLESIGKKPVYPIESIIRIQYYDLGIEYSYGANNSRYQVGIFFNPKLFKSFEPRAFCPVDRDGFTDAILARKPDIIVNREDKRPS